MLYSSDRKRALSGWLQLNHNSEFNVPLKLQKFLFFYEGMSKAVNEPSEFNSLKGYENGPVFGDVYGDYRHEKSEFIESSAATYKSNPKLVNEERAIISWFLVSVMNEAELSELTHKFNIWNVKQDRINNGDKHVPLNVDDFTVKDMELMNSLCDMFSLEYINSVKPIKIKDKCFVIDKTENLDINQLDTLRDLADVETLQNPVYVSIAEDGVLLVD